MELLYVREVMRTRIAALPAADSVRDVLHSLNTKHRQSQRLLPVVDTNGLLVGVITRGEIRAQQEKFGDDVLGKRLEEIMRPHTIEAYPDEPLRAAVYRMAEKGVTRVPVVERDSRQLLGLISLDDLLKARTRHLEEERRRERTIQVQNYFPGNRSNRKLPEVETSA